MKLYSRKPLNLLILLLAAIAMLAAACGSDTTESTEAGDNGEESAETESSDSTDTGGEQATGCDPFPTKIDGILTVATGEPVFAPWMADDDPSNKQGFESALVYALAGELGVDNVEWVRTTFEEAISATEKSYDFNIQQYSITAERDEVVDFSDGYYQVEQAIIGTADSPAASASSVSDLAALRLGAASGTTSLNYIDDVIKPTEDGAPYDDNATAKAAFDAGQVDAIVFDLPTAYYITAVEIPEASIIGVLPRAGDPEELGMVFEDGSALVECVNTALATLHSNGTIESLEDTWLNDGGSIPTLSE